MGASPFRPRFLVQAWYDFAVGRDTALPYERFTSFAEQSFDDILASAFSRVKGVACECSRIGVEVPVFNPFCLFTRGKKFKFFQTQADFIARISVRAPEEGTNELVVGDYKFLMETHNPISRVMDWKNVSQVLVNARLFEEMTNIRPSYGALVYFTRRAHAYVVLFPLRAFDGNLSKSVFASAILNMPRTDGPCVYADGRCFASFAKASLFEKLAPAWVLEKSPLPGTTKDKLLGMTRLKEEGFTAFASPSAPPLFGADYDVHAELRQRLNARVAEEVQKITTGRVVVWKRVRVDLAKDHLGPHVVALKQKYPDAKALVFAALNSLINIRALGTFSQTRDPVEFLRDSQRPLWTSEALRSALDNLADDIATLRTYTN